MQVQGLELPREFVALVDAGKWPCRPAELRRQDGDSPIPEHLIRAMAPEESRLELALAPPRTLREWVEGGETFWVEPEAAPWEVDLERALLIADFGIGSDAGVILDYSSPGEPIVRRLRWSGDGQPNSWVTMANSFGTFAKALNLWGVGGSRG